MQLRLSAALLIAIVFAAPSPAQVYVGVGTPPVGYAMIRPYWYYPYGYFGYYPSAWGSQWSNGLTLYGPPVPTYSAVAGAFGGSDGRMNFTRPDDPRPFAPRGPLSPDDFVTLTFAQVDLKLPAADATVTVNGTTLKQTGTERSFRATNLPQGMTSRLTIHVTWTEGGQVKHAGRDIDVRGGLHVRVDLSQLTGAPAPQLMPLPRLKKPGAEE